MTSIFVALFHYYSINDYKLATNSKALNDHLIVGIVITTVFKVPIIPLCKSTTHSDEFIGQEDTVEH